MMSTTETTSSQLHSGEKDPQALDPVKRSMEKDLPNDDHGDGLENPTGNLIYDNADEEPQLHARTYIALMSMFLLNFVQVFALQGPPSVVCRSDLSATVHRNC